MRSEDLRQLVELSERKYQVFISSTFLDLADQRRMVLDVVVDRGHMPIALERFPAADSAVPHVIAKAIEASQIYVLIIGFRYGAIVKGTDISFCHLEYERAYALGKVVVPFLLSEHEVRIQRDRLKTRRDEARMQAERLAIGVERDRLNREVAELDAELANEAKLDEFRKIVQDGRFYQPFSLERTAIGVESRPDVFDKHMVLKALQVAELEAARRRIPGWIREPQDTTLAETLEAVSRNRFLVDVVAAMAKFDALGPRIRDQAEEKEASACLFTDKYLQQLLSKDVSLFFESGSTVAYVAQEVGERLRDRHRDMRIATNNVLAYLIFWLVHRIKCSLFPWGPPEQRYGAVFGAVNDFVSEHRQPSFPPDPLSSTDEDAIATLLNDPYSPAKWTGRALLLGALSGFQITPDETIACCLGPHVGSPRNKVFKRFMYGTKLPVMLFLTASKIDSPVDPQRCHFILDQAADGDLRWDTFKEEYPLAFCIGCKNVSGEISRIKDQFERLGFVCLSTSHRTAYTAVIARNRYFIDQLESGMNIR
jgi:hypothetical protein